MTESKKSTDADMKKARIERYRKKTEIRSKEGGAGMTIRFYDLDVGGRKVRVKRRGRRK